MKKILKEISIYFIVFISLIILFIFLLLITSLIPSKYIEKNVRKSSETLVENGEKVIFDIKYREETLFYFTDALMLNTAYSIDSANPYYSFMMARKNYIPGQTLEEYEETQYHVGTSAKYKYSDGDTFQTYELYGLMHGDDITDSYCYARYWHGYLVFLRPLLLIFDIQGIRIFLKILITVLSVILLLLIAKKINIITTIIYEITLLLLNILMVANSINESTTIIIALITSIFILLMNKKIKRPELVFMCVGMITSFTDLLTTPLITLGLSLPLYILLNLKEDNKKLFVKFIKICVLWALGFGLTWALKWVITDITLGKHVIQNAISQFLYRLGDNKYNIVDIKISDVLNRNTKAWGKYVPKILIGILLIYILIGVGREVYLAKKGRRSNKIDFCHTSIFILISLFPFVWYCLIKNHSFIHWFFTYRIMSVFILNIQLALVTFLGLQEKNDKEQKDKIIKSNQ